MQMMLGKEHLQHFLSFPFASFPLCVSLSLLFAFVVAAVTHRTTAALRRAKGNPGKAVLITGGGGTMVTCHPGSWTGRLPVILLSACNKGLVSGGGNLGMYSRSTYIRSGTHWRSIEYWNFNEVGLNFDQAGTKF